ncbi:MAG: hypothetical protein HY036_03640 [Nitrospirae bacterium]|nr:hypothetical protein [Nitrospirota bacterium]MBI3351649.1 hypothetical protein [Nitrospirota bacterium]
MFEHKNHPVLPFRVFLGRILINAGVASLVVITALSAGIFGYHFIEGLPWVDAFLNASMILGGMGPVNELHSTAGKIFAGCYALFSGLIFIVIAGILLAPIIHRLLHRFHQEGGRS